MSKDFSAIAAAPRDAAQPESNLLPHKKGTPHFWIACHPNAWECIETERGYEWLPRLKHFLERAGVNGVRENGKAIDSTLTRTKMADNHWVLIPRDFCPQHVIDMDTPALPGKGAVVAYRAQGGWVHLARWDKPMMAAGTYATRCNHAQKWAFQRALIEEGIIAAPSEDVLELAMRVKRRRLDRNVAKAHIPQFKHAAEVAKGELEGMQVAAQIKGFGEPLTMASTKADIVSRLDALGIAYEASASKAKLLEVLNKGTAVKP
jgi:hypothetical protein